MNWQDISTAPKDGTEVLCWREDCGPFIAKYASVDSFPLTQAEIDTMDEESLFHKDWFTQWPQAFRLDGSEAPTHWMPLPAAPGDEPAAVEPDADGERYRWLRDEGRFNDFRVEQETNGWMKTHSRATLDAAIDAARSGQAAAKESP